MNLATYLEQKGESQVAFARRADPPISKTTISRLLSGERKPGAALLRQIHRMTGGKVAFADWKVRRRGASVVSELTKRNPDASSLA